ncbi:MAG: hypothetical protein NTX64_05365 [Elusimicrobia bacterium]|nr:hypothetical protein [Elusimicrobiota bacterium]
MRPTGRADDLIVILAKAESYRCARTGFALPHKAAARQAWIQPLGNVIGRALSFVLRVAPEAASAAMQEVVWRKIGAPCLPLDEDEPRLAEARRLVESLGAAPLPALVCPFTHPPITGEWLHLNLELTRQALRALARFRPGGARPKVIVGVDPFALDTFGVLSEGVYAGLMSGLHLGFDRLSSHRRGWSRAILGFAGWERMGWRVLGWLGRGGALALPWGGGVPTTSRSLYSTREFVWSLRRARPSRRPPAQAMAVLAAGHPGFADFAESGLVGAGADKSAWKMMEAWLLAVVSGAWGPDRGDGALPSADRAALTPAARAAAEACARALGYDGAQAEASAEGLSRELARETPYRARLLRILARRVAGRGRPIVFIPLSHGRAPQPRISWGEPVAIVGCERETLRLARSDGRRESAAIDAFARGFVEKNLP